MKLTITLNFKYCHSVQFSSQTPLATLHYDVESLPALQTLLPIPSESSLEADAHCGSGGASRLVSEAFECSEAHSARAHASPALFSMFSDKSFISTFTYFV